MIGEIFAMRCHSCIHKKTSAECLRYHTDLTWSRGLRHCVALTPELILLFHPDQNTSFLPRPAPPHSPAGGLLVETHTSHFCLSYRAFVIYISSFISCSTVRIYVWLCQSASIPSNKKIIFRGPQNLRWFGGESPAIRACHFLLTYGRLVST